jgi:hypothetical protein
MTKVFLSYVREDLPTARKVAARLQRSGHEVWWDRYIRGGAEFADEIDRELASADAVVVLWSERSIKSAWVRDEAGAGRDSRRLIPVCIESCTPPLGFRQYQSIDLRKPRGPQELEDAIAALSRDAGTPEHIHKDSAAQGWSRRRVLLGAGAASLAAGGAAGIYILRRRGGNEPPREIAPIMAQAKQELHQNTREGQYQAIGLFRRATTMEPTYADAWGWLGYTYAVVSHFRNQQESVALRTRGESAAHKALDLDPRCAMGELALSAAPPLIGYWGERERRMMRAFALDPHNDEVLAHTAVSLIFAGRPTEALPYLGRIGHKPLTPAEYTSLSMALWDAARLPELDETLKEAATLYPTQGSIWFTRMSIAAYAGDVPAVNALIADVQGQPTGVPDELMREFRELATAIKSKDKQSVDTIVEKEFERGRKSAIAAEDSIRNISALGRADEAMRLCEAYYTGHPFAIPDSEEDGSGTSLDQRQTAFLFEPETKSLRAHPRFEELMRTIGFDRYWRASGKAPDYRRLAQA